MVPPNTENENSTNQADEAVVSIENAEQTASPPNKSNKKKAAEQTAANQQAGQQPANAGDDAEGIEQFCKNIIVNGWFSAREEFDEERLAALSKLVQLGTYTNANPKEPGFTLDLINGGTIKWYFKPETHDTPGRECIMSKSRTFTQKEAEGIVALAAVRGWKTINVHGSKEQKDLLWLEAMRAGLKVGNHTPGAKVLKEWQDELANREEPGVTSTEDTPAVTADNDEPSAPAGDKSADYNAGKAAQSFNSVAPPAAPAQPATPAPQQPVSRFMHVVSEDNRNVRNPDSGLGAYSQQKPPAHSADDKGKVHVSSILAAAAANKQANGRKGGSAPKF